MAKPDKQIFVVISPGRAGSTMLMERLATHPDVRIQMELLAENFRPKLTLAQRVLKRVVPGYYRRHLHYNGRNIGTVIENIVVAGRGRPAPVNGFKIIEAQWHELPQGQRQDVLDLAGLRVIYLDRADLFSHFVSLERAGQFGFTFRREGAPAHDLAPVALSADKFVRFVDSHKLNKVYFRRIFAAFPWMEVAYERLVDNAEVENRRLLDFLGLDHAPLRDLLIRNSDAPLAHRVANLAEFRRELEGSPYERLLPGQEQLLTAGPG